MGAENVIAPRSEGNAREKHMGEIGGWKNKEKAGGERSKRKVCKGVGKEKDMLPVECDFVPTVHGATDISYKNVITFPQLSTSH